MTFLRDAEKAGILHRLGPQYEFRSETFRDYLVSDRTSDELSREELLAALDERDAVIEALRTEIEQLKRQVGLRHPLRHQPEEDP